MGDKGGKKDKNKSQKQKISKQEQKAKKKQDKQHKSTLWKLSIIWEEPQINYSWGSPF